MLLGQLYLPLYLPFLLRWFVSYYQLVISCFVPLVSTDCRFDCPCSDPKSFGNAPLVYRTTIGLTIIPALYDALATLSQLTKLFTLPDGLSYFFERLVPLGQFSMGWISFSILGFVLGLIISKTKALHPTAS